MRKKGKVKKPIFRKFPKTSIVIISFIACFLFLVSIELLLGALNNTYNIEEYGEPRLITLREHPPGLDFTKTKNDSTLYRIRSDENGFIMPSKIHDNADVTLVFLGGSTTECKLVNEENRFPYLSGRLIEEKTGKKIDSYNGALSGNDLSHTINTLWNKTITLKPDFAIVMHNFNDLYILHRAGNYWTPTVRQNIMTLKEFDSQANLLLGHNKQHFKNIKQLFRKIVINYSNIGNYDDEWAGLPIKTNGLESERIISQYEMALRSYISICLVQKITPVLMTQFNLITEVPTSYSSFNKALETNCRSQGFKYEDFQSLYSRMNELNRNLAAEYQIPLIDLDKLVPKSSKYFYDIIHLNQEGSILVSNLLTNHLSSFVSEL